jgi:hypothetical protein
MKTNKYIKKENARRQINVDKISKQQNEKLLKTMKTNESKTQLTKEACIKAKNTSKRGKRTKAKIVYKKACIRTKKYIKKRKTNESKKIGKGRKYQNQKLIE